MNITRALIVKKEHLDKILDGDKTWEMRSSKTNIRGRIGLIESGSGLIVGEVTLTDCGPALDVLTALMNMPSHQVSDIQLLKKWKYPWVLKDAKRYEKPIPYKHPQGAVIWVRL
jgi:hypothetical protein